MGFRHVWTIAGGLVVVIAAIALLEVSRQTGGEPGQEPGNARPDQAPRSLPAKTEPSLSAGDPRVEEPQAPLVEKQLVAGESRANLDHPSASPYADTSGIDHETGWPYETRIRVEQVSQYSPLTPGRSHQRR